MNLMYRLYDNSSSLSDQAVPFLMAFQMEYLFSPLQFTLSIQA